LNLKKAKEVADNVRLLRAWRKWHAEQLEEALASMHGAVLARLMEELKDLRSARELVDFIAAQDWSAVDANTRFTALHEINNAITKLRQHENLTSIDDPLPGQPENAFRIVKRIFESFPPSAGRPAESISVKQSNRS
jgi:hypothetical protein